MGTQRNLLTRNKRGKKKTRNTGSTDFSSSFITYIATTSMRLRKDEIKTCLSSAWRNQRQSGNLRDLDQGLNNQSKAVLESRIETNKNIRSIEKVKNKQYSDENKDTFLLGTVLSGDFRL